MRDITDQKLIVVRNGYETVLRSFLERMEDERKKKVEKTGDTSFTEFEAFMPELVRFILPDRKCRIVLEYDPAEPRVELRREVTEEAQKRQGDINPDRLRKSEILSLARLFHVSIGTATGYRDILAAQVKQSGVELK